MILDRYLLSLKINFMRKISCLIVILGLFMACQNKPSQRIIAESSGNLNELNVIVENEDWNGKLGEHIRDVFAADFKGLPQQEPQFNLRQIPPEIFTGFARKNRIFIKFENTKQPQVQRLVDSFAQPQVGYLFGANSTTAFDSLLRANANRIINDLQATEIKERQRRIAKSLKDDQAIRDEFNISLNLPTAYRYAKTEDNFIWLRKDIKHGSMELTIYEVPAQSIEKNDSILKNIIQVRDSIGKVKIPGPTEESFMSTEKAYAPYLFETKIDGKFAYEVKGTWEVKGFFMGGPFLTYAVKNSTKNTYLMLEGFVFKPSASKRTQMIEVEAILRSAQFIK